MCWYTTAIVSITACLAHAPKKCTQSGNFQFDIKSPPDFKILSARKLKALVQKYKLQLTTGIQACMGHVLRKYIYRQFLKDTATTNRASEARQQPSCTNSRKELRRNCSAIGHNNTKHFLCPIRSRHALEFLEIVR